MQYKEMEGDKMKCKEIKRNDVKYNGIKKESKTTK